MTAATAVKTSYAKVTVEAVVGTRVGVFFTFDGTAEMLGERKGLWGECVGSTQRGCKAEVSVVLCGCWGSGQRDESSGSGGGRVEAAHVMRARKTGFVGCMGK